MNQNCSIEDVLENLKKFGTLCNIKNINRSDNSIIVGEIVQIKPISVKAKFQSNDVLICEMKEVHVHGVRKEREIFKIIFVNLVAETVSNLTLCKGDFLAVHKPKLFYNSSYARKQHRQTYTLVIGLHNSNEMNLFYKRKENTTSWENLNIDQIQKNEKLNGYNKSNTNCALQDTTSCGSRKNDVTEEFNITEQNICKKGQSFEKNKFKKQLLPEKQIQLSCKSVLNNFLHQYEDTNEKTNEHLRCNDFKILNLEFKKLVEVEKNMEVKLVAIINKILKNPTVTATGKYHVLISIIDETKSDDFNVHVYFKTLNECPILQEFNIIFFHHLKIEEHNGKLEGCIFDSNDVMIIDKENTDIVHGQLKNYQCTLEDKNRIEELRNWMLENILISRPFTPFSSLQIKNQKLNLRCQLINIKLFCGGSTSVLRVRDGTKCSVPFFRYSLEHDYWPKVHSEAKGCSSSDEIDIVVTQPDETFLKTLREKLQVGQNVELYNVHTTLNSETIKTKIEYSLKAHLMGKSGNLKIISPQENKTKLITSVITSERSSSISSKTREFDKQPKVNKRKLFTFNAAADSNNVSDDENTDSVNEPRNYTSANKNLKLHNGKVIVKPAIPGNATTNQKSSDDLSLLAKSETIACLKKTTNSSLSKDLFRLTKEKTMNAVEEFECRNDQAVLNDRESCFVEWPQNVTTEAFYIKVCLISTIPVINADTSDFDLMSLVNSHCTECDSYFPFYLAKWIHCSEDGPISICPKCKQKGMIKEMNHLLMCELLLQDKYEKIMPAVVIGCHAENFFGCSIFELCSSAEIKMKVREHINFHLYQKGNSKKFQILKVVPVFSDMNKGKFKYHVLS